MDDLSTYNPDDALDIQSQLARVAALRKQALQQPQGQVITGRYVAPATSQLLAPVLAGVSADVQERQANQQKKDLDAAAQADLQSWIARRPQAKTVYGAGPDGPTMDTVDPSSQDITDWAAQGSRNPLAQSLAQEALKSQVVTMPEQQVKYDTQLEKAQMISDRMVGQQEGQNQRLAATLAQRDRVLTQRIAEAQSRGQKTVDLENLKFNNRMALQRLIGQQKAQNGGGGSGGADLTPEAIDDAAFQYNTTGVIPPLGQRSGETRGKILNRAAELAAGSGPGETVANRLEGKATGQAMGQLQKQQAMVGAFENTFNQNADLALAYSKRRGQDGMPAIQKWINAGHTAIGDDPDLAAFNLYTKSALNEYSKIISGSMGNTALAEGEIKKVENLLNTAQTAEQYEAVIKAMKQETQNRLKGFEDQRAQMRKSVLPKSSNRGRTMEPPTQELKLEPGVTTDAQQLILNDYRAATNPADKAKAAKALKDAGFKGQLDAAPAPAAAPAVSDEDLIKKWAK